MFNALSESDISKRLTRSPELAPYLEKPFEEFAGPARKAAVLIPFLRFNNDWHILFTRRTETLDNHKGQVSFPGGRMDPEDSSLEATALREAQEEVGILPQDAKILGKLGQYLTVTNYLVAPVAAIIPWPYVFRVSTAEVGRVFTIPLTWLADKRNYRIATFEDNGRSVVTYLPFDGEILWGATARMTVTLIQTLEQG